MSRQAKHPRVYRVGIDVGTHSVGLAAIEVDSDGNPVGLLSAVSHIHDSGVFNAKNADTRLKVAGVARRTRRMRRRRVKRLSDLDARLRAWGWTPLEGWSYAASVDPHVAWRARARLASEQISDPAERGAHLATALRHIARHRGWRNPYLRVSSLYESTAPSKFLVGEDKKTTGAEPRLEPGFKQRVEERVGHLFPDDVTVAELALAAIDEARQTALRMGATPSHAEKQFSFIGGKLLQSDNANEIHAYAQMQGLEPSLVEEIIDLVFAAESPRGSWVSKVGTDPLDPTRARAPRAADAFQRFRIAQHLGNVRLRLDTESRPLTVDERQTAFAYLLGLTRDDQPTWGDVATALGLPRRALTGAAAQTDGEERIPLRPPVDTTSRTIGKLAKPLAMLTDWWEQATGAERDALIELLVDGKPKRTGDAEWEDRSAENGAAWELLNGLDDELLVKLDGLDLEAGRASYSAETLRRLTERMLTAIDDLHAARTALFDLPADWSPPSPAIGEPIGNPAVDRVTKAVSRWLMAAESAWGAPQSVTIEHVRDAFVSESRARQIDRDNQLRHAAKLKQRESVGKSVGAGGRVRESDVRRYEAVGRQKGICLYCGDGISYDSCEMDHIVPRKGVGSTNTRANLAAICVSCNRSKSNIPFAVWAKRSPRDEISVDNALERTQHWLPDNGVRPKVWARFLKDVRDRLEQEEHDPELDARSMESVAWMANELRARIADHFGGLGTSVSVYRGALTAQAREASGIAERIPWAGGSRSKDRFDRRHHAVDASVSALLTPSVALTLGERISLREEQRAVRHNETWKQHRGRSAAAESHFMQWLGHMNELAKLLTEGFEDGSVVVTRDLRLRLANGPVHDDTVRKLAYVLVGSAFPREAIDRASTPALWTALTRDPDFDPDTGLPENGTRTLRIHGTRVGPTDTVALFPRAGAMLAVRGGYADAGAIHHARIYRREVKGKRRYAMLGVYAIDLVRHKDDDLFAVTLPPSSVSIRAAGRWAEDLSDAEYLGWLVPDDVLSIQWSSAFTGSAQVAAEALRLGAASMWRVVSFDLQSDRLKLTPALLAEEGLDRYLAERKTGKSPTSPEAAAAIRAVLTGNCWRASVDKLFKHGLPMVIRRDVLGRERWHSPKHLPTSWRIEE